MCFDMQADESVHDLWEPIVRCRQAVLAKFGFWGIMEKVDSALGVKVIIESACI